MPHELVGEPHRLIAELTESSLMQRERKRYFESCECTRRVQQRARSLHRRLDSVIVFDIRFHWWGLGNNLIRWLTLLRVGLASGRATFLWMSSAANAMPRALGAGALFDLGAYFMGDGWSWQWTEAKRQQVHEHMASYNVTEPSVVYHMCKRHGLDCEAHELQWAGGTQSGTAEEERSGALLHFLTSHPSRWLLVRPWNRGPSTAFQPSASIAAAILSGQAGALWGGGWSGQPDESWDGGCWRAGGMAAAVSDRGRTEWQLSANVSRAVRATESAAEQGRPLQSRLSMRCDAFAL